MHKIRQAVHSRWSQKTHAKQANKSSSLALSSSSSYLGACSDEDAEEHTPTCANKHVLPWLVSTTVRATRAPATTDNRSHRTPLPTITTSNRTDDNRARTDAHPNHAHAYVLQSTLHPDSICPVDACMHACVCACEQACVRADCATHVEAGERRRRAPASTRFRFPRPPQSLRSRRPRTACYTCMVGGLGDSTRNASERRHRE